MTFKRVILLTAFLVMIPVVASAQNAVLEHFAPNAPKHPILHLTSIEKIAAVQNLLHIAGPITLGDSTDLTVNNPYAANGAHLQFFMPTIVMPNAQGGAAVVSQSASQGPAQSMVFVTSPAESTKAHLFSCRIAGANISYRIGSRGQTVSSGSIVPTTNATPFAVPATSLGSNITLTLWSAGAGNLVFFGCEITPVG